MAKNLTLFSGDIADIAHTNGHGQKKTEPQRFCLGVPFAV